MNQQKTLWHNATLYTGEAKGILHGAMLSVDGIIEWVGPENSKPQISEDAKRIDCHGRVLMPGFIDCHTHLIFAGSRSAEWEARLQGQAYEALHQQGGGIQSTVRATRAADFDDLFRLSEKRLQAMIAQGVTTIEIKSGYGLDLDTERKMLQVASALGQKYDIEVQKTFLGAHTLAPEFSSTGDYMTHIIEVMLPALAQEDLIDCVDVFTETIGFTLEDSERLFKACQSMGLKIKCHAEQLSSMGAAKTAARYDALSVDHLEHITEQDIQILKEHDTVAVLLPGAYYFLKEKTKPPVDLLRKHQVPMAVATDCNPGTSPATSLPLMLNMACTLFGLYPNEALQGATLNAAKALGLSQQGELKPGMMANCALWDLETPLDLVYQIGPSQCHAAYHKGKQIYGP